MEKQITEEEWSEFENVVIRILEGHQDPNFIESVALCLGNDVINNYQGWKITNDGSNSNCAKKTRFVLKTWKSLQTQLDLPFLVQTFDQKVSSEKLANELKTKLLCQFSDRIYGKGNLKPD